MATTTTQKRTQPAAPEIDVQYTTHDVAAMLQVDPSTVSKWVDKGTLLAFRTPGGHRRIRARELRAFLAAHHIPVPAELGGDDSLPGQVDPKVCPHSVVNAVNDKGAGEFAACRQPFRLVPLKRKE